MDTSLKWTGKSQQPYNIYMCKVTKTPKGAALHVHVVLPGLIEIKSMRFQFM
jgi:hypothetical protein